MQPRENWRTFDSVDRAISVATLLGGDFLVKVSAGAVAMTITVPPGQIGFLFPTDAPTPVADGMEAA